VPNPSRFTGCPSFRKTGSTTAKPRGKGYSVKDEG
jgi:hypothetical protein